MGFTDSKPSSGHDEEKTQLKRSRLIHLIRYCVSLISEFIYYQLRFIDFLFNSIAEREWIDFLLGLPRNWPQLTSTSVRSASASASSRFAIAITICTYGVSPVKFPGLRWNDGTVADKILLFLCPLEFYEVADFHAVIRRRNVEINYGQADITCFVNPAIL